MVVGLILPGEIEEALGDGEGALVDGGRDPSLQQHLQHLAVCGVGREALAEREDFVLHSDDGHLQRAQIKLEERSSTCYVDCSRR